MAVKTLRNLDIGTKDAILTRRSAKSIFGHMERTEARPLDQLPFNTSMELTAFEEHQDVLLQYSGRFIKGRVLDIGCGNGINAYIIQNRLPVVLTLCDIVDLRHPLCERMPFVLIGRNLQQCFHDKFDTAYVQYVTHHVPPTERAEFFKSACGVASRIVCVEEIAVPTTNSEIALRFDRYVNQIIHPGAEMPAYEFLTRNEMIGYLRTSKRTIMANECVSRGSATNGGLQTWLFVAE